MPQVATVTVQYINQPQKNPNYGSIKADGTYYSVPKNRLAEFEKGKEYTFEYTTNDKGYHNFKEFVGGQKSAAPAAGHNSNGSYKDASPETAERIFVCGLVNGWAQSGKIDVSAMSVIDAVSVAREAWSATLGAPE